MDFKDYLTEEEKKVDKFEVTFAKDTTENEVYVVLANKEVVVPVFKGASRYVVIAASEAIKLSGKGSKTKLLDLKSLTKHVNGELAADAKE